MAYIELKSPLKREKGIIYEEYKFKFLDKLFLPLPRKINVNLLSVLNDRKTERNFNKIDIEDLSTLLWYSSKTISAKKYRNSIVWEHKYVPSAGGLHPVHTFVYYNNKFFIYENFAHAICTIKINPIKLNQLINKINAIIPIHGATILIYGADYGKSNKYYKHFESLIWRDSGCILMMNYLIASALGIGCCGLGITCEPFLSELLCTKMIVGVGGVLLG
jgi:SagB-type dehydrogenase family enzyme